MPDPVTVWKVELVRGQEPLDVPGTLSIGEDELVFEDETGTMTRIPFAEAERAKRLRGSPVLVIRRRDPAAGEIAFYFVEPPPLHPPDLATLPLREATRRRPSKRRQQRANTGYLTGQGRTLKPTIDSWVVEVASGIEAARRGPDPS